MSGPELSGAAPALALLPSNAAAFEKANSQGAARLFDLNVGVIETSRDPANCDAAFVPFLAWERSVHFYDPNDEAGNRARAASSFADHLAYGSAPALEAEIALDTGQSVHLVEYFEERDLEWPDFVVESVINPGDLQPDLDALLASALMRKNVRDWPIVRTRVVQPPAVMNVGAAMTMSIRIANSVRPAPAAPYVGAAHRLMPEYRIPPL